MLEITAGAARELRSLLSRNKARQHQSVRLSLGATSALCMTIDTPHLGDTVVRRGAEVLLVVDGSLSRQLATRMLDFGSNHATDKAQNGFALLSKPFQAPIQAHLMAGGQAPEIGKRETDWT